MLRMHGSFSARDIPLPEDFRGHAGDAPRLGGGVAGGKTQKLYWSTLFTMVQAGATALIAIVGVFLRRHAFLCLVASSVGLIAMPVSCAASLSGYPGGDDGAGWGWLFYVGAGSLIGALVGEITLCICLLVRHLRKRRQKAQQA